MKALLKLLLMLAVGSAVAQSYPTKPIHTAGPIAQIKSGRLRALAVSSGKRLPALPDVPTLVELGYPDIEDYVWIGLFAPAATPQEALEKLNAAVRKVMEDPQVRERFVTLGFEPGGAQLAQTAQYVHDEAIKWARIVRATGAKAD